MGSLSAWGPTIVSIIMAIFAYGALWQRAGDNQRRLDSHDKKFEDHEDQFDAIKKKDNEQDIALVRIEEFQRGYDTAMRAVKNINASPHA